MKNRQTSKEKKKSPFRMLYSTTGRLARRKVIGWLYPLFALGAVVAIKLLVPGIWKEKALVAAVMALASGISFFAAGYVCMSEREGGVLPALYISGTKAGRYIGSKCLWAAVQSLLFGIVLVWLGDPKVIRIGLGGVNISGFFEGNLSRLWLSALLLPLSAAVAACLAVAAAFMCRKFSSFSFLGGILCTLMLAPPVIDLFFGLPAGFLFHPGVAISRVLLSADEFWKEGAALHLLSGAGIMAATALAGWLCARGMLRSRGG